MAKKANNPVGATQKSLSIIEELRNDGPLSITNLSDRLGTSNGTIHHHLSTLREYGYVTQSKKKYRLSHKFLEIGSHLRHNMDLYRSARGEVDRLARESGEWAELVIEEDGQVVYLYHSDVPNARWIDAYSGSQTYLHCCAVGKAILSKLSTAHVTTIIDDVGLPSVTDQTITDENTLLTELDEIRERDIAFENGERIPHIRAVAAPITSSTDEAIGAIGIAAPTSRTETDYEEETTALLTEARANIELDLRMNNTYS